MTPGPRSGLPVGDGPERIPWEERSTLGLWRAFQRTLVLSVREPTRFFALAPRDGSVWPALVYGFLFEIPVALLTFVYQKVIGEPELRATLAGVTPALREVMPKAPELVERLLGTSALVTLLLSPVSYLFELLVTAGGPRPLGALERGAAQAVPVAFATRSPAR